MLDVKLLKPAEWRAGRPMQSSFWSKSGAIGARSSPLIIKQKIPVPVSKIQRFVVEVCWARVRRVSEQVARTSLKDVSRAAKMNI